MAFTYNALKKRWIDEDGKIIPLGKGFWNQAEKRYYMYGSDGTVTKYSVREWMTKLRDDLQRKKLELEAKHAIPMGGSSMIRITQNNPGGTDHNKDRGAYINQALVDSLLKYGKIENLPKAEALGIGALESTSANHEGRITDVSKNKQVLPFLPDPNSSPLANIVKSYTYNRYGNMDILEDPLTERMQSPVELLSNWHYFRETPYNSFLNELEKYDSEEEKDEAALRGRVYTENQAAKYQMLNPILDAFRYYKTGGYNSGDPDYMQLVRQRGKELLNSPEVRMLVNNSKYNY